MSDTQVALIALKSVTISNRIVADYLYSLAALTENYIVTLKWVPSHQGK